MERFVRPLEDPLGGGDLLVPERGAVRPGGVALGGGGIGNHGAERDQCRAIVGAGGLGEGGVDGVEVVAIVHAEHVPAIGAEAGFDILAEGEVGASVDGDGVVIPDHLELAEAQVSGERGGFVADSFHEVAVRRQHPGPVLHDVAAVLAPEDPLGDRHPHRVADALSQRSGRGLHADRVPALRVPRGPGAPLPKLLQLLHRQVVAGQVEQRVEQHRGVAAGEDEAVAVWPGWMGRSVLEMPGPEQPGRGRQGHRRTGMTRVGRLHRVHGQHADRVDGSPGRLLVDRGRGGHGGPVLEWCGAERLGGAK
jgi:hypothetical protein